MARKKKHPEHMNHEAWLVAYADFITLLFAFFVVMFATSQVDSAKLGRFVESVRKATNQRGIMSGSIGSPLDFSGADPHASLQTSLIDLSLPVAFRGSSAQGEKGGSSGGSGAEGQGQGEGEGEGQGVNGVPPLSQVPPELLDLALRLMSDEDLANKISLRLEARGAVVSLMEVGFFGSGKAGLMKEAGPILSQLAGELRGSSRPIRFEGHADDRPISTKLYPSNWELSSARAMNVLHYFEDELGLEGHRLSAGVYGSQAPLRSNKTAEGRSKNRRVDIVLINEKAAVYEPVALPQPVSETPALLPPPAYEDLSHEAPSHVPAGLAADTRSPPSHELPSHGASEQSEATHEPPTVPQGGGENRGHSHETDEPEHEAPTHDKEQDHGPHH